MHVLLIEDEVALCRLLQRALQAQGDVVDLATDGTVGLVAAQGGGYDVIILDLGLPDIDGLEVCRRLRAAGSTTPVLMLTARRQVEDRVQGFDVGADDYLDKPFALAELLVRLRALVRRSAQTRGGDELRLADLVVNTRTRSVRRGERRVDLTAQEYALLDYMLHHAGAVLTRREIIAHVWPRDFEGLETIVDTYIHYLRDKIDRHADRPLVQTVRGVGYALREE